MRELQSLRGLVIHPNVVELLEVIRDNDGSIFFVFEYMETGSVHDILVKRSKEKLGPMSDYDIRCIIQQVTQGVAHLHRAGFLHRDLKPENILLNGKICKVADFSLAREVCSKDLMTSYVSTRWYRAPEVILAAPDYSLPVDLFAVGCIASELYKLRPLFPGVNECDQLKRIFDLTGTPASAGWKEGERLLKKLNILSFDAVQNKRSPSEILQQWLGENNVEFPDGDNSIVDFIGGLLTLNPAMRLTAEEALMERYFRGINLSKSIGCNTFRPEEFTWGSQVNEVNSNSNKKARGNFSSSPCPDPTVVLCSAAESGISLPTTLVKHHTPANHIIQSRVQVTVESIASYSRFDLDTNSSGTKTIPRRTLNPYNKLAIRAGK
jgi:male germ cell-associated kinase